MPQLFFVCYQLLERLADRYNFTEGLSMKKLITAISMSTLMSTAAVVWAADAPEKYQSSCFACHAAGAAGAPKTGDVAAWQPRLDKGMEVLITSVKKGMNAMPPTGLCATCSDEELEALIVYMAAPAE